MSFKSITHPASTDELLRGALPPVCVAGAVSLLLMLLVDLNALPAPPWLLVSAAVMVLNATVVGVLYYRNRNLFR